MYSSLNDVTDEILDRKECLCVGKIKSEAADKAQEEEERTCIAVCIFIRKYIYIYMCVTWDVLLAYTKMNTQTLQNNGIER